MFQSTTATEKLLALKKRIRGIVGGTSASKTISILLILIDKALTNDNLTISVVSESFPHLYRGAMKDFLLIMKEQQYFKDARWNKTHSTYTFETGTIIEFFSVDQQDKVRGPRRDILFVNEANNISYDTFTQLEIRTKDIVWLDWNPTSEYWWYADEDGGPGVKDQEDADFITLTYKDNEALPETIVKTIEAKRHKTQWWKVFGEGQLGELEGKIYTGWRIINAVPQQARLECAYLDYGFTNDPTASGAIYYINGWYIIDQLIHQTGLLNRQIANLLKPQLPEGTIVVADSAEPKSNAELTLYGLAVLGANKGKDSIKKGIDTIQDLNIAVTKRSVDVIKEYRNYIWLVNPKTNKKMNIPVDEWNHHMDGMRYGFDYIQPATGINLVGSISPVPRETIPTFVDEMGNMGNAFAEAEEEVGRVTTRSQL